MKKIFLLVPVTLAAAGGLLWINSQTPLHQKSSSGIERVSKSPEQLFTLSQDSLRLIVRHGDEKSIAALEASIGELEKMMVNYEHQGLPIEKTEKLILQYKSDSMALSLAAKPSMEKLRTFDREETQQEDKFLLSIDQIGLYELKAAYKKMDKTRLNYLKEPSEELENQYRLQSDNVKEMIRELYLDSVIEDPLYAYIDAHKGYFETVTISYKKAGLDRVHRLRENAYAIKTELQMLPTL